MTACALTAMGVWAMNGIATALIVRVVRRWERRRAEQRHHEIREIIRKRREELQKALSEPTFERPVYMAKVNELMVLSQLEGYWGERAKS